MPRLRKELGLTLDDIAAFAMLWMGLTMVLVGKGLQGDPSAAWSLILTGISGIAFAGGIVYTGWNR